MVPGVSEAAPLGSVIEPEVELETPAPVVLLEELTLPLTLASEFWLELVPREPEVLDCPDVPD